MKRHLDEEIKSLKEKLILMADLAGSAITNSIMALKEKKGELIKEVFKEERRINRLQMEIDNKCLGLLATRQPMGGDLRLLTACIKVSSELERIGDEAVNIAERAEDLLKKPLLKPLVSIPKMAEIAQGMMRDAIEALLKKNEDLARSVCERDDEVDEFRIQIFRELLTYMLEDTRNINQGIPLSSVSHYLERIGDHATNIAENAIYVTSGEDIRHPADRKRKE